MYSKEMFLVLMFFGTVNAITTKHGFYLDERKQSNTTSIKCISMGNRKSLTAKVLKDGDVLSTSLVLLKSGYEQNLQIFAVAEFGWRQDLDVKKQVEQNLQIFAVAEFGWRQDLDVKKQFDMLITELNKKNLSPMIFINVHSLRTGISKNQTAEQLINAFKATADAFGLDIGLQSSKHDYQKIVGNINLDLPLMYDSTRNGPFVPFASFKSPQVDLINDLALMCGGIEIEGLRYTTTIEQEQKVSRKSAMRVSFTKLSNKN